MIFKTFLNALSTKGNLVYRYSPFFNFQVDKDVKGVYDDDKLYIEKNGKYVDNFGNIKENVENPETIITKDSIVDFDTNLLNFDEEHPVDITIQPSYDGSVNLILNDGKNIPRLINSRFSPREKNTYEIVDRIGENDTNIYNEKTFDKDTSLYFLYESNPKISFLDYVQGNLPVGQYFIYLTYCDSDDNESDYIAESGGIPVFVGENNNLFSMDGGIKNQDSQKGIRLRISNLNSSYNYLKIYYLRYLADYDLNRVVECRKINLKYLINSNKIYIQITGYEQYEEFDVNLLNITRFNPKSVLTQAQCKNMLFFGNIVQNADNYTELTDCALRIYPTLYKDTSIDFPDYRHNQKTNTYYNAKNIYDKVGYFNKEYYRFGIVFIYNNGTLSNVYNTLGYTLNENDSINYKVPLYDDDEVRRYIKIDDRGWIPGTEISATTTSNMINSKGVCYLNDTNPENNTIYGIKFNFEEEVIEHLKTLGVRGFFIVRLKCIPNLIAQCYILPMDDVLEAPIIEYTEGNGNQRIVTERFIDDKYQVTNDYKDRLYDYSQRLNGYSYAAICPDFLLNQPYYNLIFNKLDFVLERLTNKADLKTTSTRFYEMNSKELDNLSEYINATICSVTEDVSSVAIYDKVYKLKIGEADEAWRFGFAQSKSENNNSEENNIVRGIYSPYLAIYTTENLKVGQLYNIYKNLNFYTTENYQIRMDSNEPYYAISDRYNFEEIENESLLCWRGDCYLNVFTYRLNRNFNDATLPNNDNIIDSKTWESHYKGSKGDPGKLKDGIYENWGQIIRSDINAVLMGSWITIYVRSATNYSLRSEDHSFVSEEALMGTPRTYYPRTLTGWLGAYKSPDSYLYNDAYRATLGYKCYFTLNDANYIKNTFSNRIQYSAIAILDSFKNNYRYSLSTYYRDYSLEYGGITKLVEHEGNLIVVFEHAIGLAQVNERILMSQNTNSPVFINTLNVLPEELEIITDTYGSQWSESVIKSEAGYIYGVDTIAKKIWRIKNQQLEILSDFKVNSFLSNNISLKEKEITPIIGLKNVKTHYNNNKKDIMFTFYDDVYKDEEKVWNLCYNEILNQFITFYSWVPSYSENIDTQFFSFDRDSSKLLTLLWKSNYNNSKSGISASPVVTDTSATLYYNRRDDVSFTLLEDRRSDYKKVSIKGNILTIKNKDFDYLLLVLKPNLEGILEETLFIMNPNYFKNLTTDFYLHGKSGIIDFLETLKPTYWYGKQHPFEFEFVVNDKIGNQKIFENLILISNKAEPESFHFEIEGDNYEFSTDKRVMYFRLEATKETLLNMGSNILFDRKYTDVAVTSENPYRLGNEYLTYKEGLVKLVKSTIFPLYYERVDTYDNIYHDYRLMKGEGYDFKNLSGSEIIWNRDLNQFNVVTHIKNNIIDNVGVLRGNSRYKEGKWNIQIPSISFMQKNEEDWEVPPLVFTSIPNDVDTTNLTWELLPNTYKDIYINKAIDTIKWTYRLETKIRDKWMKIRVRYSGKNLAIIHSLITLYNISYA